MGELMAGGWIAPHAPCFPLLGVVWLSARRRQAPRPAKSPLAGAVGIDQRAD